MEQVQWNRRKGTSVAGGPDAKSRCGPRRDDLRRGIKSRVRGNANARAGVKET